MTTKSESSADRSSESTGSWFYEALWRLSLAASVCAGVVYAASVLASRYWPFELATHFRIQMAAMMVPLAGVLLSGRRTPWTWAFVLFTSSAVWSMVAIVLPTRQPPPGPTTLRLMSANVLLVNSHYDDFVRLVDDIDPDILLVIEYTKPWDQHLACLREKFPYSERCPRAHGFGLALFSKRPLLNVNSESLIEYFDAPTISCEVEIDGRPLSIVGLHAVSPLSGFRFDARNEQYIVLASKIGQDLTPRIVIGDFNSTPWSPFIADFLRATGLRDSRRGFGLQTTWPSYCWPLRIPIDQAYVSDQIYVHRRWVEHDVGSDHSPIVVDISLSPARDK